MNEFELPINAIKMALERRRIDSKTPVTRKQVDSIINAVMCDLDLPTTVFNLDIIKQLDLNITGTRNHKN